MTRRRALFLDRDGVINVEKGYVHRREQFTFQKGIFTLCSAAESLGYLLIIVTNQAGIARGYYTESEFLGLTEWMIAEFDRRGVLITKVYYCPYHPVHGVGEYRIDSPDRKPKPGMLLRAQADYNLDLKRSVLIGDKPSDISAAEAAGVSTRIWLRPRAETLQASAHCHVADSLYDIRNRFFCQSRRTFNLANLPGRGGATSRRSRP
jgi:D-glycero-D-manno-heptose 1,7-bisphosphate phosphatase